MKIDILHCSDSLVDLRERGGIPNESIDLVITDPPYGINLTPQRKTSRFKNTKVINDNSLEWLDDFVNSLFRVSKNIVCIFCAWQKNRCFQTGFSSKIRDKKYISMG